MPKTPRSSVIDPELGISAADADKLAAGDIALLDDPAFNAYKWSIWRLRLPDEMAREPQAGEWEKVATKIGPLDEDWVAATLGGGTFELRGYFDDGDGTGRRLVRKPIIAIAGPRKNFAAAPPPVVTPAVPNGAVTSNGSLSRFERIMLRMLKEQNARLAALEKAPAPAQPMAEMIAGLRGLDELRGRTAPPVNPDREAMQTMIEMLDKGREIGERSNGTTVVDQKSTDFVGLAKELAPLGEKLLDAFVARRRATVARPASTAVEVSSQQTPAPAPEPDKQLGIDDIRWIAVGDALTRAIADGDDPIEFAGYLERQLSSVQLLMARTMPVEKILQTLLQYEPESQVLKSEAAAPFIVAVLAELNAPAES